MKGKSYRKIGEELGVSKQTVGAWADKRSQPRTPQLIRLAEITGISLDWILTGKESEGTPPPALTTAQAEAIEACRLLMAKLLDIQRIALIDPIAAEASAGVLSRLKVALEKPA